MLCCLREWLEFCATRQRSRIRVSSGNGYATPESVARQWRIDPEHAQIGVTATADTPFVATPGGHASWGMRAPYGVRLPTACSGPRDRANASDRFASLPATTHGLPATCVTAWDRRGTEGMGMGTRSGDPYRTTVPISLPSSHSLRGPHAVRGWI